MVKYILFQVYNCIYIYSYYSIFSVSITSFLHTLRIYFVYVGTTISKHVQRIPRDSISIFLCLCLCIHTSIYAYAKGPLENTERKKVTEDFHDFLRKNECTRKLNSLQSHIQRLSTLNQHQQNINITAFELLEENFEIKTTILTLEEYIDQSCNLGESSWSILTRLKRSCSYIQLLLLKISDTHQNKMLALQQLIQTAPPGPIPQNIIVEAQELQQNTLQLNHMAIFFMQKVIELEQEERTYLLELSRIKQLIKKRNKLQLEYATEKFQSTLNIVEPTTTTTTQQLQVKEAFSALVSACTLIESATKSSAVGANTSLGPSELAEDAEESAAVQAIQTRTTTQGSSQEEQETGTEDPSTATSSGENIHTSMIGSIGGTNQSGEDASSSFMSGYDIMGNTCSLKGLQCLLFPIVEQTSAILRSLVLAATQTTIQKEGGEQNERRFSFNIKNFSKKNIRHEAEAALSYPTRMFTPLQPIYTFSNVNGYHSNLEYKLCSAHAGCIFTPKKHLLVGMRYDYAHDPMREAQTTHMDTSFGSAKAQTDGNTLSAIVGWNTKQKGLCTYVTSCYGWGRVKTIRSFTHHSEPVFTKGNPSITFFGGLMQLGYTVPVTTSIRFTPYIEHMVVMVKQHAYKETSGSLPAHISHNKERVWEKSIGIRYHWDITSTAQVQAWVGNIFGQQTLQAITSRPLISSSRIYEAFMPGSKKRYTQREAGISYEVSVKDMFTINIHGRIRYAQSKKPCKQHIQLVTRYIF